VNVCFVSHSSDLWGAERSLLELIDALLGRGVHPRVIVPSQGPLCTKLRERGVGYAIIPFRGRWLSRPSPTWKRILKIASIPISALLIAKQIRRWRCDVVYSNTLAVCEGALAAWLVGSPHIWHIHEYKYQDHGLVFHLGPTLYLGLVARLSSVCIACSHAVEREYAARIPAHKLKTIYPSITFAPLSTAQDPVARPNGAEPIRCVMVGALAKGKRQEDAIRAIAEVVHSGIAAELVLVGNGDARYERYLRALAREQDVERHVIFAGYLENPLPIVQNATMVLLCSQSEAFPRITIEGMLAGKPVIGTRSGGTVEQVREGFNGLLYTPGNVQELAQGIRYLHAHPQQAQEMGRNGRQWALAQFSQDRYGAEILALLQQVAKRGRAGPAR
jgi:glycosyltransferase involved in cell wall biosynthesis